MQGSELFHKFMQPHVTLSIVEGHYNYDSTSTTLGMTAIAHEKDTFIYQLSFFHHCCNCPAARHLMAERTCRYPSL